MQDALALLSAALDSTGYIAIRGFGVGAKKDRIPRQKFFAPGDYAGACAEAKRLSDEGFDSYFATCTFLTNKTADAAHAHAVKCFKIDLDVGEDTEVKYASKKEAVTALVDFCGRHSLPLPVLVDSGFGVHGYWILTEALDVGDGKLYSEKLKALFINYGLKHDKTVTGDIVRVLRTPDTLNNKKVPARRVKLKTPVTMIDTDKMLDAIDIMYAVMPDKPEIQAAPQDLMLGALPAHLRGVQLDKDTLGLISGKPKKFSVLVKRMNAGDNKSCAQLKDIYDKQGKQNEPRWRAGLSIARFCDDGDEAIHKISERHPDYSFDVTVKKAALIPGPHKCSTFEANWPELCKECPHKGKITSPIQLGDYVPLADKKDNIVLGRNKNVDDTEVTYIVPEYPWPYVRGKNGGVYRRDPEDEDNPTLLHKFDLYVVDRLRDETDGYIVQLRHHHPKDGVIEFTADAAKVGAKDGLREILNKFGIMKFDKEALMIREYIRTWMNQMELQKEVSMVRTQFGWTDGYKSFVLGDSELTAHSNTYSRIAPSMSNLAKVFTKQGDREEWRKIFNVYAMPGMEAHAFCALVGFGSILMPLLDLNGVLINAYSQDSGTGKSTTLQAAASIWGDPSAAIMTYKDTALSRFNRMGQYKNLPICVDEITKMNDEDISDFLLSATSGRGRNRMSASANTERVNNTTWAAISLSSANKTFIQALQADKVGVDGELMRLLEPHIKPNNILSKEQADAIFGGLKHHYGHAGREFVQYLMQQWSRVKPMLEDERRRIDTEVGSEKKERFWSAACACVVTGTRLAAECGLHDIDPDKIRVFAIGLIRQTRARLHYTASGSTSVVAVQREDILGEFMSENISNTLTVNTTTTNGKETYVPLREPSRELFIRYERNTGKLFIAQAAFNKFMKEKNIHIDPYLDEMKASGVFISRDKQKRMSAGLPMPSSPVRVYEFYIKDDDLPPLI